MMDYNGLPTMDYNELQWGYHGLQWITTDCDGLQWITVDYDGLGWTTMDYDGLRWITMDYDGLRWITMDYDDLRWIGMDCNGLQWITMDCNGLWWLMEYHILSVLWNTMDYIFRGITDYDVLQWVTMNYVDSS